MTLTTSTESDFLRSPLDEVIEVAPPQGKIFFYQSQIAVSANSTEYYYNKWKPLIEKKFVG